MLARVEVGFANWIDAVAHDADTASSMASSHMPQIDMPRGSRRICGETDVLLRAPLIGAKPAVGLICSGARGAFILTACRALFEYRLRNVTVASVATDRPPSLSWHEPAKERVMRLTISGLHLQADAYFRTIGFSVSAASGPYRFVLVRTITRAAGRAADAGLGTCTGSAWRPRLHDRVIGVRRSGACPRLPVLPPGAPSSALPFKPRSAQ
jgi:hypothetical protein